MASEYKYRDRDVKDVKERAEQQGGAFDKYTDSAIPVLKMGKSHTLRILPPAEDWDVDKWGNQWNIPIYVHYSIGPDKGTYLCLEKMDKGPCPLCEARASLTLEEGEQDPLRPSKRYLAYVIDRNDEREGPQLVSLPWTFEREIQSLSLDDQEGLLKIDHPDEGYDISFSREGKGVQTKYVGTKIARAASPLHPKAKIQDEWLDYVNDHPLYKVLKFETYDYLDKVYRAKAAKKEDDKDDGEPKERRGRRGTPAENHSRDNEDTSRDNRRSARSDKSDGEARGSRTTRREEAVEDKAEERRGRRSRTASDDDDNNDPEDQDSQDRRASSADTRGKGRDGDASSRRRASKNDDEEDGIPEEVEHPSRARTADTSSRRRSDAKNASSDENDNRKSAADKARERVGNLKDRNKDDDDGGNRRRSRSEPEDDPEDAEDEADGGRDAPERSRSRDRGEKEDRRSSSREREESRGGRRGSSQNDDNDD